MADTMKFGPQWLRALSDGGNVSSSSSAGPKTYKLAEHRYGREEMLALLCYTKETPSEVQEMPSIAVEKSQKPLALIPLSEEEQRLSSQCINSAVVLRMMGRPSLAPPPMGIRGRGTADRGRGRGRGRGDGYYPRGPYEEDGFGRGRHTREGWEEGHEQHGFEHGSTGFGSRGRGSFEETSPTKGYFRSMSTDNWRESRKETEEDDSGDWRRAGPPRERGWGSNRNWRDQRNSAGVEQDAAEQRRGFDDYHRSNASERPAFRRSRSSGSYDGEYEAGGSLPEWSTADVNEELGTFDATGAFMSMKQKGQPASRGGAGGDDGHEFWDDAGEEKQEKEDSEKKEMKKESAPVKDEKEKSPQAPGKKSPSVEGKHREGLSPREDALCGGGEAVVASQTVASKAPDDAHSTDAESKEPKRQEEDADFDHLEKAAEDLVATLASEEELKTPASASHVLPKDHEDAKKWLYRDPQGDLQGPFTSSEMAEWFSAGYFTMNLLVKRGSDEVFQALGDLIKIWGSLPFMAASSPPPPAVVPQEVPVSAPVAPHPPPNPLEGSGSDLQLKAFLHQQALAQHMQQQQALMLQLQQVMSQLQQQEAFNKLNPQQQQQLAMQLLMRQAAVPSSAAALGMNKPPELSMPPQQKVSPRSQEEMAALAARAGMQWPPTAPQGNVPPTAPTGAPAGAWAKPVSVWDIENTTKSSPTSEENQKQMEADAQREEEEEQRQRREREELERQEMDRQREIERQQEIERQRALERQRELERRQDLERQRLEKLRQETEEARQRQQVEDERRRAAEKRRQEEALRVAQEEEDKRRRQLEVEHKKQEEFRRRQEKAEELKRQQHQETVRRLQQEQLSNMQLPAHAQWGNSAQASQHSTLSLAEIQEVEAQRDLQEREQQMEMQREQMSTLKQQQQTRQQQQRSWAATPSSGPSLLDIQQEEEEKQKHKGGAPALPKPVANSPDTPLAQVWASSNPSANWATEGTWGSKPAMAGGFWDEPALPQNPKKTKGNSHVNNSHFPALNNPTQTSSQAAQPSAKSKPSRSKKEEEAVQRLFQAMKPQDDFTRWCESALKGLQTSVDVPTFVAFLKDVDSPYEVNDYVRSYLGESPAAASFAKEFIEKRSRHKNQQRHQEPEESMWGPAPAVNPNKSVKSASTLNNNGMSSNQNPLREIESEEARNKKKSKKKMQKMDASSFLGFTVQADSERVNIGEIDTALN